MLNAKQGVKVSEDLLRIRRFKLTSLLQQCPENCQGRPGRAAVLQQTSALHAEGKTWLLEMSTKTPVGDILYIAVGSCQAKDGAQYCHPSVANASLLCGGERQSRANIVGQATPQQGVRETLFGALLDLCLPQDSSG